MAQKIGEKEMEEVIGKAIHCLKMKDRVIRKEAAEIEMKKLVKKSIDGINEKVVGWKI